MDTIFNFAGGSIAHLLDSIYKNKKIKSVVVHHEQAGAFAAEGLSRVSENIGVATATSGPGATNMVTGIASSFFDSIPVFYITGQVNTYEYKFTEKMRQRGFQETDIISIIKPVTKLAHRITDPEKIRFWLEKMLFTAKNGRAGPVLLDIPLNIQRANINPAQLDSYYSSAEYLRLTEKKPAQKLNDKIKNLIKKLQASERPLVLCGGGIRSSRTTLQAKSLILKLNIPVVSSLMGLDVIDQNDPKYCGMIGSYGNRNANITMANCDLLIVLGSRLDTRQTGTVPESFARQADIFHIDIDLEELKNRQFRHYHPVRAGLDTFLILFLKKADKIKLKDLKPWKNQIKHYKKHYSSENYPKNSFPYKLFFEKISKASSKRTFYSLDVGQNQMWASQYLKAGKTDRILNSGGLGAMGFSLPAAMGAYFGDKKALNIVITGDGGFQINIQELETIKNYNIPLKIFVLNNYCLGMVREFQEIYFEKKYQSTVKGYSNVSFKKVAYAYDLPYFKIDKPNRLSEKLQSIINTPGPVITEVILPVKTHVYPKLFVNHPVENQSPPMPPERLKKEMIIPSYTNKKKR